VAEISVWTIKELLDRSRQFLEGKGVPTPRLDAEVLLAHVLGRPRIELYLEYDKPLGKTQIEEYRALIRGRGERRPVAYLVGGVGFWSLDLYLDDGALIPSPDTETVVEAILSAAKALRAQEPGLVLNILEMGTGSGAIPLAVLSELEGVRWVGVERSSDALRVALRNREKYSQLQAPRQNRLLLIHGDRFSALSPGYEPHMVVGNPPYIPTGTIDRLMPEVSRSEPRMALDGGPRGTDFQRYMMEYASVALTPEGRLIFEMGADQERLLRDILTGFPALRLVELRRDLARHPRAFHARRV